MTLFKRDTGNYRIIKKTAYNDDGSPPKVYYEPQKETYGIFGYNWTPICYQAYAGMDFYDHPFECVSMQTAQEIINKYKTGYLSNRVVEEVVCEERN